MVEFAAIGALLTSVKSAIDIGKSIKESSPTLKTAEIKLQMAGLISALADAKIQISEINEELSRKDKKINELEEKLSLEEKIEYRKPFYFIDDDGPYCQKCWDVDKKLVRLQDKNSNDYWDCLNCKCSFRGPNYNPHPPSPVRRNMWD